MIFQELLIQVRGKDWIPPKTLIAIDPGETCGYAVFLEGGFFLANQRIDIIYIMINWFPNVVVYEDYKIYPGKLHSHSFSDIPTLKVIGAIEYICQRNQIKVIKIMASTAKGFVSNIKLKEWNFYEKGKVHAMDALRVGLHTLLFSKEI